MSGRTDSVAGPAEAEEAERIDPVVQDEEDTDFYDEAGRARRLATGTGALLTLAGTAAALLRLTGTAPALVPAAYATGAAVCAAAALLGARGRTRRALWLLIAGTMIMALGDQFD
ncbi:hypothetical protein ABZX97_23750 [Streptomyces seoulensis]|uniref:hypothetical protein n=1 Tax=Streptomyces seoulensis TaxID=73044 RepID=UPI00339F993F